MERVFSLFRTGYFDDGADTGSKDKKKRDFADAHWGDKAHIWVSKIAWSRWDCILADTEPFISAEDDDDDDDCAENDDEAVDPRTLIFPD